MYQVNDGVLYGMQGVCRIDTIEEREFSGKKRMYYVLKPVYQKASTIYVPLDNTNAVSKMRKVLSEDEIARLIQEVSEEETKWIANDALRKETFARVLHGGNREDLMALIKAVYLQKQKLAEEGKRKLHVADENTMKEAERILYEEFAYVLHLERTEVLPFIIKQIEWK